MFSCTVLFLRKNFINLSFSLRLLGFFGLWEFGPFKLLTPWLKLTLFTAMEGIANNHFSEGLWGGGDLWLFEGKVNALFFLDEMHAEQQIPSLSRRSHASWVKQSL